MSGHEQSCVTGLVLLSETAHPFTPQGHCQGMTKPVLTSWVPLKDDKLSPFEALLLGSATRLLATQGTGWRKAFSLHRQRRALRP